MTKMFKTYKKSKKLQKGEVMKRMTMSLEDAKLKILALKGSMVEMDVNRGRKKIDKISGTIKDIYPSVFTVQTETEKVQTFSYYDVLCGNIKITNSI